MHGTFSIYWGKFQKVFEVQYIISEISETTVCEIRCIYQWNFSEVQYIISEISEAVQYVKFGEAIGEVQYTVYPVKFPKPCEVQYISIEITKAMWSSVNIQWKGVGHVWYFGSYISIFYSFDADIA